MWNTIKCLLVISPYHCLNSFFFSCSPAILLLISTVDSCFLYFRSDILFVLLVVNYVLPNVLYYYYYYYYYYKRRYFDVLFIRKAYNSFIICHSFFRKCWHQSSNQNLRRLQYFLYFISTQ
jgi:hypothetical protein